MSKQEFLAQLRKGLSGLPQEDVEEHLAFYCEMLEDQMEEGLSEEEAVAAAGSVSEIVAQVVADIPLAKIAAFSVMIALYAVVWSVLISLWVVLASLVACALGGVIGCTFFIVSGNGISGVVGLATGLICTGFSIFMFYGCKAATRGTLLLTKKIAIWIKNCFIKEEV